MWEKKRKRKRKGSCEKSKVLCRRWGDVEGQLKYVNITACTTR
jgi:hypothetical protein